MENEKDDENKINEIDKPNKENIKNIKKKERNNYSIDPNKLLGKGSFGKIFAGVNKTTGEEIAIKLEPLNTDQPQLVYEYKNVNFYKRVLEFQKYMNVPKMKNILF